MDLMTVVYEALREKGLDFEQYIEEDACVVLKEIQSIQEYYSTLTYVLMELNGQDGIVYRVKREGNTTYITATI